MFLFSAANNAFSQNNDQNDRIYSFSFGPLAGFVYGQSFEYVYKLHKSSDLLSELIWDIKPIFYLGSQFDFGRADLTSGAGVFASLQFKAGFPAITGVMEDRDWTSNHSGQLTHYSEHTNKTAEFFWLDFCAGTSIPIANQFYIKPLLAFSWMHFSFIGSDGFGTYEFENWEYHPFSGEVITYMQDWLLASLGVSFGAYIGPLLQLEVSFKYTPLTYCAALDHHITTKMFFRDFSRWGHYIEPSGSLSLKLNKADLTLEFSYREIGRTRGESFSSSDNNNYFPSANEAGAALSVIDTRLVFKIIF